MKTVLQFVLVPALAALPLCMQLTSGKFTENNGVLFSFRASSIVDFGKNEDFQSVSLADIDAAADNYAPLTKEYTYNEAIELRKNLVKQIEDNTKDLGIYWALLRYYANAPNFVGGNSIMALQVAGYIYGMNRYLGCMAYEYAYSRSNRLANAELWYKRSLTVAPPKNMFWQDITYNTSVQSNIKVVGNFNNWKMQHLYEDSDGNYKRRIMVPKCENCQYKLIIDDRHIDAPTSVEMFVIR